VTKVMDGVRILEVAQFTFTPSAGAVLTDWGADVIKIEHPVRGDAQRGIQMLQRFALNPMRNMLMQHPNRGKRSVGLDLSHPEGVALLYEMVKQCDVFITNYLPSVRQKLRIDLEHIRAANPNIIYVRGSAFGEQGPDRDKGGYDSTAFWARGGSADLASPKELDGPMSQPGPAYGDTIGGMFIAGGVAAALFHRSQTGQPSEVDVSLLSSGIWATACSIDVALEIGYPPFEAQLPQSGSFGANPFVGSFKAADGKSLCLTILKPGPYIRDTFEHLNLAELADDPRFATAEALFENVPACSEHLIKAIAEHPLSYWMKRLSTMKGQWAPYQSVVDVADDPQVIANNMIFEVDAADDTGKPMKLVASPVQFNQTAVTNTRAPEPSEHTEMVLMEMGIEWDRLADLKAKGAIA
jgi:crotonobetainyl-CoA:carnitine CoA-transferase CaiB-like acyl-CoA transferase